MQHGSPLITNDAVVLGILMVILAFVFRTSHSDNPRWKKFYGVVPSLLLCYFIPSLLSTFGIISGDQSNLYFVASRYLLPTSLVLLTLSIDLPAMPDTDFDDPFGGATGSGVIFGVAGNFDGSGVAIADVNLDGRPEVVTVAKEYLLSAAVIVALGAGVITGEAGGALGALLVSVMIVIAAKRGLADPDADRPIHKLAYRIALLRGTRFTGADLRGAALPESGLRNCDVTGALMDESGEAPAPASIEHPGDD